MLVKMLVTPTKKHSQVFLQVLDFESGAYENRTHDLLTASKAETFFKRFVHSQLVVIDEYKTQVHNILLYCFVCFYFL